LSIWEDALADGLVLVGAAGGGQARQSVELTIEGRTILDRFGRR
jgi:hypothetical protein